jgi:hypothetical protein
MILWLVQVTLGGRVVNSREVWWAGHTDQMDINLSECWCGKLLGSSHMEQQEDDGMLILICISGVGGYLRVLL